MFNPCEADIQILKKPEMVAPSLYSISALACTELVRCPNQTYPGKMHNVRKLNDNYTKYVVFDMINKEPIKVNLWAQKWQCNTCKKIFVDPSCPYKGKKMTSPDFDEYVASYYLSLLNCDVEDIEVEFGISTQRVWQAVRNYRKRYEELRSQMQQPQCSKVWLIKHYVHEKPYLLIVGEHRHTGDLVIIGFCPGNVKDAIEAYNLNAIDNPVDEFLTDNNLVAKEFEQLGIPVTNIMATGQADELPLRIYEICALLDDLEERHYTIDTITLRIEMIDEYRRNELRRLGAGRFLFPQDECNFRIKEDFNQDEGWV